MPRTVARLGPWLATVFAVIALASPRAATRAADTLSIRGSLTYRGRIALPPDSVAIVELREGLGASATIVAEQRIALKGRQLPVAFDLQVDSTRLQDATPYVFRGSIASGGQPAWTSDDVLVDPGAGERDVGFVLLKQTPASAETGEPFSAGGNEPGWRLDIARELTLVADYGSTRVSMPAPAVEAVAGGRKYTGASGGHSLVVVILDRRCEDTMTGFPRPNSVEVTVDGRTLKGCGGDGGALLRGPAWTVEDVAGAGIVDRSRVTIEFGADGRVTGTASCNTYSGEYAVTPDGLAISRTTGTLKACSAALMQQETAFLEILRDVERFSLRPDGALVLHAADGRTATARRP